VEKGQRIESVLPGTTRPFILFSKMKDSKENTFQIGVSMVNQDTPSFSENIKITADENGILHFNKRSLTILDKNLNDTISLEIRMNKITKGGQVINAVCIYSPLYIINLVNGSPIY